MAKAQVDMMLVGKILERIGALGDAELAGMMGQLMQGLNSAADETAEVPADTGIAPAGKQYVVCVEATLPNGEKVQHPYIGGGYAMPRNIEDVKMTTGTDRAKLERSVGYIAETLKNRFGVKVTYVLVSDEVVADLEKRLYELLQNLVDAIEQAAEAKAKACSMMNVTLDSSDVSDAMLREVIQKTLYAGSAVNAAGEIVERVEGEKYAEEQNIENGGGNSDEPDGSYEDDYIPDDDDDEYCEEEDD